MPCYHKRTFCTFYNYIVKLLLNSNLKVKVISSLAQINIRFKTDLSGFSTDMQNVSRRMQRFGTDLNSIGRSMSTYITLPILAAGGAAIKFASDYQESVNKVETAFGPASESVKAFAKDSLTSSGIAEGSALDMAASFGDMSTSMGLSQSQAAKMSVEVVKLAGDLASFKNIGIDQANTALAGIWTGETESLKKLGIVLTEANLQQFALSKGIKTQVKDMDQASKVNLRYAYIMANTTNAQGDFARTGGGASNQMRIFQESLKQLAQQFGAVILPAFTKVIVFVNNIIKGFSDLDPVAKGLIIGIAGIAAAIGPLMVGLGNMIGLIPRLVVQFTALKATMLANPYTAAAIGIAAVALAVYAFVKANKDAATSQEVLNSAIKKGNENAAGEIGILDKLYASATNVNVPIKERRKNVDDLQAVYPAYFGNLKDEVVLNGLAKDAYVALRDAIFNKSRAMAIDNELQNRANERIKTESKLRQDIVDTENEIARIKKGSNTIVLQEASAIEKTTRVTISKSDAIAAQTKLLDNQKNRLERYYNYTLGQDKALLDAKTDYMSKTGDLEANEAAKLAAIKIGTDAVTDANGKLIKSGTIEFYEAQIAALQKTQKSVVGNHDAWQELENKIIDYRKQIAIIEGTAGVKLPKPVGDGAGIPFSIDYLTNPVEPPTFKLNDLTAQLAYFTQLRLQYSDTQEKYNELTEQINNTQIKIKAIEGVDEFKASVDDVKTKVSDFSNEVSSAISSGVTAFVEGFTQAITQGGDFFNSVGALLFKTLGDMMVQLGKAAITIGIGMLAIKAAFKSPLGAIASGAALILAGTLIKSSVQNAGAFANGGMVGGTSFTGDKLFARVNSGEMILNQKQQSNLSRMINPAVTAGDVAISLIGGFEIDGAKLKLVLDRTDAKKNRLG